MFRRTAAMREVYEVDTIIGAHTEIRGKVGGATGGVIRIEGRLQGELDSEGDAVIGEGGEVVANIRARDVIIGGTVHGDIEATGRLELLPTARVYGDVRAGLLVIAEGALFQGTCQGEPQPRDDYQRTTGDVLVAKTVQNGKAPASTDRSSDTGGAFRAATPASASQPAQSGSAAKTATAATATATAEAPASPFPPLSGGRDRETGGTAAPAAAPAGRSRWPQQARERAAEAADGATAVAGSGSSWTPSSESTPQVASGGIWR